VIFTRFHILEVQEKMKNVIYILLSLLAAAVGIWQMYLYIESVKPRSNASGNLTNLIVAIICIVAALALGGLYLAGRVNKEEELHITK
jgi:uncharacterized membrane protein YidH (DUF202 family)